MNIAKKNLTTCLYKKCKECEFLNNGCEINLIKQAIAEIDDCYAIIEEQRKELMEYDRRESLADSGELFSCGDWER